MVLQHVKVNSKCEDGRAINGLHEWGTYEQKIKGDPNNTRRVTFCKNCKNLAK